GDAPEVEVQDDPPSPVGVGDEGVHGCLPSPPRPPSSTRGEGGEEVLFPSPLVGEGLGGGGAKDARITCNAWGSRASTTSLRIRTKRNPNDSSKDCRRSSTSCRSSCTGPSTSTIRRWDGAKKSTTKGPIGCCLRNLTPASCRPRRDSHKIPSPRVGSLRN